MTDATIHAGTGDGSVDAVRTAWGHASDHHASEPDIRKAAVRGWEGALKRALDDGLLEPAEEERLEGLQGELGLTEAELDVRGAHSRLEKAAVLREVMSGSVPDLAHPPGDLPFNFLKSEKLVWLFRGVEYLEDKTRREYVGGYKGVSIRIAKGLYYRTGGFKGRPVERTERVALGRGLMAVTTKHLYFAGATRSFRIRYNKIVSYTPYTDGIGVMRDAATAKPQIFVTGDGWFTYNLIENVSRL